jgi:hypothetical protein
MVTLNIMDDESLSTVLTKIISGILPHSKYDATMFGTILESIDRYVKLEELQMEYYLILSSAKKLFDVTRVIVGAQVSFSKETLIAILENNIQSVVRRDEIGIKEWLERNAYRSNLDIPEVFEETVQMLFNRTIDLYNTAIDYELSSAEAISYLPALELSFLTNASEQSMITQSKILNRGVWDGKKRELLVGPNAWVDYVSSMALEISQRTQTVDTGFVLDSVAKAEELIERLRANCVPLAEYGIPPVDMETPILQHRYVVLVGEEGIGKTILAMSWVVNLLLENKRVCVFSGENDESKTFVAGILPCYILKKYGLFITYQMILDREHLEVDKQKIIAMSIVELTEGGNLRMVSGMNYYNVYQTMKNVYDAHGFDAWIIDHSLALDGGGDFQTKLFHMSLDIKNFRKKYPVYVLVLSHTSSSAKAATKSEKKSITESPTKYSGFLSADADEVFVLYSTEELYKKNLLGFINYKRRGAAKLVNHYFLTKLFAYSSFRYESEMQRDWGTANLEDILTSAGIDEDDVGDGLHFDDDEDL